jgi:hypothetical protein
MMNIFNRISVLTPTIQKQLVTKLSTWKMASSLSFGFSKLKKSKPELKAPWINFKKLNEVHEGLVLYQN